METKYDLEYGNPLPLALNPRVNKRRWRVMSGAAGAVGKYFTSKFRRGIRYLTPGNVGLAAAGIGVGRRLWKRSGGMMNRTDAGPAGRVSKSRGTRRRGRSRIRKILRRRRVRRYKNFRRMLNSILNPRLIYGINYTKRVTQAYNRKQFENCDDIFNLTNVSQLSAYFNNKTYASSDWFYIDSIDFQAQLVNISNSETYVTVYIMKCLDNSSTSFIGRMVNDTTNSNVTQTSIVTSTGTGIQLDRTTRLSQFTEYRKYWKCIRKKYIKMEGGAVTSIRYNFPIKKSVCPLLMGWTDSNIKGFTMCVILEVRSQIVGNSGDTGIVWDNAVVGYGSNVRYKGGRLIQQTRLNNTTTSVYATAATPMNVTDVDMKTT